MVSTIVETETAQKVTVAISMVTALCVGATFAAFLVGIASPEKTQPVSSAASLALVPQVDTPKNVGDTLLIKYKSDVTEEQKRIARVVIQSPQRIIVDTQSGAVIPSDKSLQDGEHGKVKQETRAVKITKQSTLARVKNNANKVLPSSTVMQRWEEVRLDAVTDTSALALRLATLPFIESVQPSLPMHLFLSATDPDPATETDISNVLASPSDIPNDYYFNTDTQDPPVHSWGQSFADQWGLKSIGISGVWTITTGNSVVVAVIDSGIDRTHPELAGQLWVNQDEIAGNGIDDDGNGYVDDVNGWDFNASSVPGSEEDNDPSDDYGHGTFVAGIIGAKTNNSIGMAGICWNCQIMSVKAAKLGGLSDSHIVKAIMYAVDNGAQVINMSFGGQGRHPAVQDALRYAYEHGVVMVAAAGNGVGDFTKLSPASAGEVISVGALNPDGSHPSFSDFGDTLDVSAPGVDILSLRASGTDMYGDDTHVVDEQYYRANGTSFAAPYVTGLVALMLSEQPNASIEEIRTRVRAGAQDLVQNSYQDCTSFTTSECYLHGECALRSGPAGTSCQNVICPTLSATECGGGNVICLWDSLIEKCDYFNYNDVQIPEPLDVGRDKYTGTGLIQADASMLTDALIYGTILTPYHGSRVSHNSNIAITGTVSGPEFTGYTVSWKKRNTTDPWQDIITSTVPQPIPYSMLANWDTSGLQGWYSVQLTIHGQSRQIVEVRDYFVETATVIDDLSLVQGYLVGLNRGSLLSFGTNIGQVYGEYPNSVFYRQSPDNGQTFAPPVLVGQGVLSGYSNYFPSMVARSQTTGTIFVSWSEFKLIGDGQNHHIIYLSRSTDNGVTFGAPVTVTDHAYPTDSFWEQPYLSVDSNGDVYIGSQDARPIFEGASGGVLYVKRSVDDGRTWGAEIVLADNISLYADKSFALVARNGTVHAVFNRQLHSGSSWHDYTYYVAYRVAGGLAAETQFPNGHPDSLFNYSPTIHLSDSQTVFVGWNETWEGPTGDFIADIFLVRSTSDGATFSAPYKIRTEPDTVHGYLMSYPYITHDADGIVYVLWVKQQEKQRGFPLFQGAVFASISYDHGATFAAPKQVSDVSNVNVPTVTATENGKTIFVSWDQYDVEVLFKVLFDKLTPCGRSCAASTPYCNRTNGQCQAKCADGTAFGTCSGVSRYCNNSGTIVESCLLCGCQAGQTCKKMAGYPGGKCVGNITPPVSAN